MCELESHTSYFRVIPRIYGSNYKLWIKDHIFITVQVEPITQPTQTTRTVCSPWGVVSIGNIILRLNVQACMAHYNRTEVHWMKMKSSLTGGSCAGMLQSTRPLNSTGSQCKTGIWWDILLLVGLQRPSSYMLWNSLISGMGKALVLLSLLCNVFCFYCAGQHVLAWEYNTKKRLVMDY